MSPLQLYLYRYPHNFCKYEMLPIPCCIIIPLMCGLSCGLQKLYMHKHGSGNRLEQERKQHTSCHPITRAHHRRTRSRAAPTFVRAGMSNANIRVHLPCRFILQLHVLLQHFIVWIVLTMAEGGMNESFESGMFQSILIHCCITSICIYAHTWYSTTIDSCRLEDFFCGHGRPGRATQWYASHISLHVWQKMTVPYS